MSVDWQDEIPSWRETEQRAADEREARRDRLWNRVVGAVVFLIVVGLIAAVAHLGGELS